MCILTRFRKSPACANDMAHREQPRIPHLMKDVCGEYATGIYKNSEVISGERFYFTNLQSWIQKGKLMQIRIHNPRLIA